MGPGTVPDNIGVYEVTPDFLDHLVIHDDNYSNTLRRPFDSSLMDVFIFQGTPSFFNSVYIFHRKRPMIICLLFELSLLGEQLRGK